MNTSRLRLLAAVIWTGVLLCGMMLAAVFMLQDRIFTTWGQSAAQTPHRALYTVTPSRTPTPFRQVIYLPSATARPVSPTPITPTATPFPTLSIAQFYAAANANPLTGLLADPNLLERRPVAVKISTFPRGVRAYQSGLSLADVVYEYYIEDGLTRFAAVFYGQNALRAGPVRSGRYFDEHIMRMYHAVLVFVNADERVETYLIDQPDLRPLLFLPRPENCPPLCRDTAIRGYNNVFVDTSGVGAKITDNSRQELRQTTFGPLLSPGAYPVITKIFTHYSEFSYNYWEYDPTNYTYWRFSDAQDAEAVAVNEVYQPHIDQWNGQQISAQNVVVLVVPHVFNNEFDRADQVFNIRLVGAGTAYIFREGRMILGAWLRDRLDQPIQLVDKDRNPIPLQPGVTFYQVINPESAYRQNGETVEFFFFIPPRVVTLTPTPFGFQPSPTPKRR
ncbi:MAG: DUF3048 domain-containing protein [Anaerolineales bacterium]|nr:DUF3048 domain-containing protein [Anaerolineales bacterium]